NEADPGKVDEGRAEQRQEQPVAACRRNAQQALALSFGIADRETRHHAKRGREQKEEQSSLPRPGHPCDVHGVLLTLALGRSPWRCSCARTRSRARRARASARRRLKEAPSRRRPRTRFAS